MKIKIEEKHLIINGNICPISNIDDMILYYSHLKLFFFLFYSIVNILFCNKYILLSVRGPLQIFDSYHIFWINNNHV